MNKRIVCIMLLFVLSVLVFNVRRGATQSTDQMRKLAQVRERASILLQSPMAKYLSGSGHNALSLIVNPPEDIPQFEAPDRQRQIGKIAPLQLASYEVMVNDPWRDIFTDTRDISTQSETAVASFNSTIVIAYNDSGQLSASRSAMGYSRSTDGGLTFVDMDTIPAPRSGQNLGDPGIVADSKGNFYVSSITFDPSGMRPAGFENAVGIYKSTDGGLTFQPPVYVPPTDNIPFGFEDKMFIAADNSGNPQTDGNIYVSYTHFSGDTTVAPSIAFSRSINGGASFSTPIILSAPTDVTQGSEPVVGRNGEIYVTWLRTLSRTSPAEPPAIFIAKSTDGGQSFSPPRRVASLAVIGFGGGTLSGGFRVNSFPRIDVDPMDGNVYVVYAANQQGADGADVFLTRSTDGGITWPIPVKVNNNFGSGVETLEFFPDVAVNSSGTVQVIWYSERLTSSFGGSIFQDITVQQSQSSDGGRTFGFEFSLTSSSFSPAIGYDPLFNRTYMGDYLDIKAGLTSFGRDNRFLMTWGDCRRSVTTLGGTRADQDVLFSTGRF